MRAGKVDPKGVVYLGDGAWGVGLRTSEPDGPRWYIAKSGTIRHFFLVTLYPDQRHIVAVNDRGEIFDEIYQRVKSEQGFGSQRTDFFPVERTRVPPEKPN